MNTEHGRGEDGNFVRMWDEVNHCGKECKRTEGAQAMTGLFSWPKRLWRIYVNDWRYPVALYWAILAFRTADCRLAFGFGLDWLWASLFLLQWLMFFCGCWRSRASILAFVLCNMLYIGGCYCWNTVSELPKDGHYKSYDRLRMGSHSAAIPAGSWGISYSHDEAFIFASERARCFVSEDDFLWFCRRNGYKVRLGTARFNERTGEWMDYDPMDVPTGMNFYAYSYIQSNNGGTRLLYDRSSKRMTYDWSSN